MSRHMAAVAIGNAGISNELWQTVLDALDRKFTKPVFNMWLKPMRPVALDGMELTLAVQNAFARDWCENRLKTDITDAIRDALQIPVDLQFVIADASAPHTLGPVRGSEELRPGNLNGRYTFEEFVVGASNRFAHAAAQAVACTPGKAYNPLFLYGGVGLGKTHLMHAIGRRVLVDNPNANVLYVSCEKFTNEFIIALQNNRTPEFRKSYRQVDVLLIDDVQFLAGKETTQEEFFHTFNDLHSSGRQLVLSSDRPPKDIQTLEARLRSRFEWGLQTDIQAPDLETREAILRKKAESENIPVPHDVTSFIAKVIPSNIRELEGALIRVVAYASLTKAPITTDLAAEVLKSAVAQAPLQRVTIAKIKETVAGAYGLTVKEMDNGRRDQRLAGPRQIAMYIATTLTDYSLPQIARDFGKKDHTTIMYARDKIKDQIERDEAYRNKIVQLMALCQTS
ncbi:MAG TPA: chromosomal replication initiator protein DnaA [Candidatus Dormibacteraeota bacterium]|nr:chromosomal replication initiator protein DnaA [Candidatus Dormibacteraeota bacterium]